MIYEGSVRLVVSNKALADFLRNELARVFPSLELRVDPEVQTLSCLAREQELEELEVFIDLICIYAEISDIKYVRRLDVNVQANIPEHKLSSAAQKSMEILRKA